MVMKISTRRSIAVLTAAVALIALACAAPAPPPAKEAPPLGLAAPVAGVTRIALTGDGKTYPGPYFIGKPDAPLRLDEFSDFQ
jgi:hypothetical protein